MPKINNNVNQKDNVIQDSIKSIPEISKIFKVYSLKGAIKDFLRAGGLEGLGSLIQENNTKLLENILQGLSSKAILPAKINHQKCTDKEAYNELMLLLNAFIIDDKYNDSLKIILEKWPEIAENRNKSDINLLHLAYLYKASANARLLLNKGYKAEEIDNKGNNALHYALMYKPCNKIGTECVKNIIPTVKQLINNLTEPEKHIIFGQKNSYGLTPYNLTIGLKESCSLFTKTPDYDSKHNPYDEIIRKFRELNVITFPKLDDEQIQKLTTLADEFHMQVLENDKRLIDKFNSVYLEPLKALGAYTETPDNYIRNLIHVQQQIQNKIETTKKLDSKTLTQYIEILIVLDSIRYENNKSTEDFIIKICEQKQDYPLLATYYRMKSSSCHNKDDIKSYNYIKKAYDLYTNHKDAFTDSDRQQMILSNYEAINSNLGNHEIALNAIRELKSILPNIKMRNPENFKSLINCKEISCLINLGLYEEAEKIIQEISENDSQNYYNYCIALKKDETREYQEKENYNSINEICVATMHYYKEDFNKTLKLLTEKFTKFYTSKLYNASDYNYLVDYMCEVLSLTITHHKFKEGIEFLDGIYKKYPAVKKFDVLKLDYWQYRLYFGAQDDRATIYEKKLAKYSEFGEGKASLEKVTEINKLLQAKQTLIEKHKVDPANLDETVQTPLTEEEKLEYATNFESIKEAQVSENIIDLEGNNISEITQQDFSADSPIYHYRFYKYLEEKIKEVMSVKLIKFGQTQYWQDPETKQVYSTDDKNAKVYQLPSTSGASSFYFYIDEAQLKAKYENIDDLLTKTENALIHGIIKSNSKNESGIKFYANKNLYAVKTHGDDKIIGGQILINDRNKYCVFLNKIVTHKELKMYQTKIPITIANPYDPYKDYKELENKIRQETYNKCFADNMVYGMFNTESSIEIATNSLLGDIEVSNF